MSESQASQARTQTASREALREEIERRMASGEPFTFGSLHRSIQPNPSIEMDRLADQCMQRWRKRGWLSLERVGRDTIWTLTDAGRKALANG